MVSYISGQIKFKDDDLGSKVKVTVTENVCENDDKNLKKFKSRHV